LAQALLVRPELLVLDEPWSGLDAEARAAVLGLVAEVLRDGGRVLVTDHQQQAARVPNPFPTGLLNDETGLPEGANPLVEEVRSEGLEPPTF
jgi:Fe-S cluster assembly ATPase SufC